jgi:hypothetical protein
MSGEENLRRQQPEKITPLTLTLLETAQRGVLQGLMQSLRTDTNTEVDGWWEDDPQKIAQVDETRNVTTQIAKSLKQEIDPLSALYMGLTDLLPEGQLEQWANMDIKDQWDQPVKAKAQYFLSKKLQKLNHSK